MQLRYMDGYISNPSNLPFNPFGASGRDKVAERAKGEIPFEGKVI